MQMHLLSLTHTHTRIYIYIYVYIYIYIYIYIYEKSYTDKMCMYLVSLMICFYR